MTSDVSNQSPDWSIQKSLDTYGVKQWGQGFFSISKEGLLSVIGPKGEALALTEIIEGMQQRGLNLPAIVRFEHILQQRIRQLNEAFANAIQHHQYQNVYRGVFPIKVNQQCHVVEEIAQYGEQFHHGLEAGSKAELLVAMSKVAGPECLIICNGYKDADFIRLGLYATAMGLSCIFVLETVNELEIILQQAKQLNIEPMLGVRIRSSVQVDGHWQGDSGERSLFGLSSSALMQVVQKLKRHGQLCCLKMLHCHLGSQIPNLANIEQGAIEACHFYQGLIQQGAQLSYLDLGGGLAVDYEGAASNHTHSMNYDLDEYCGVLVKTIGQCFNKMQLAHPVLVTESGRATVAYGSVLLFNVLDVRQYQAHINLDANTVQGTALQPLVALLETVKQAQLKDLIQLHHQARQHQQNIRQLFCQGQLNLMQRVQGDELVLSILQNINGRLKTLTEKQQRSLPDELRQLPKALADIYYGNFSLFQSLPDIWAIDQIFPLMPIHRLHQAPTRQGIIADLTCDCDGKIDQFVQRQGVSETLSLHPLIPNEEYYLGVFLVGAYQETLGDLHNLFGDTHVVSIEFSPEGHYQFKREIEADSLKQVLNFVEYDTKYLSEQIRKLAEQGVESGRLKLDQRQQIMSTVKQVLAGDSYFRS